MKRIHVVAAVIERGDSILIARRPDHAHQGGKWEFPGGKLESGEQPLAGLDRELEEELGIRVRVAHPLITIAHDYPDKRVLLDVWRVSAFEGQPHGREGQQVKWVAKSALREYEFPAANVPIIAAACLPSVYVISPDVAGTLEQYLAALEATLKAGHKLIQIRIEALSTGDWRALLDKLRELREQHGACFLLNSHSAESNGVAAQLPDVFDGIHFTSRHLMQLKDRPAGLRWMAASCHSVAELQQAQKVGVDFVTLSPVLPTQSHPDGVPLGWNRFREWVCAVELPVFALGGMGPVDVEAAWNSGAQGIAGIRSLWAVATDDQR